MTTHPSGSRLLGRSPAWRKGCSGQRIEHRDTQVCGSAPGGAAAGFWAWFVVGRGLVRRPREQLAEVLPLVERHLGEMLAWAPYEPTPDYEPRPEPGRRTTKGADPEGLRVPVLNPLA